MSEYRLLTDIILDSEDYFQFIKESKTYNVKKFDEFVKIMQDFDNRVKAKDIETQLSVTPDNNGGGTLEWYVNQGYMNDKDRILSIKSFDNGKVECDKTKRFRAPGSTNLNDLVDVNQILKLIDGYLYSLEREDKKNQNSEEEKSKQEKEDENFTLDPSITQILDNLKSEGESLLNRFKSAEPLSYKGKEYKIEDGELMASTEKELILNLLYSRSDENDIYDTGKEAEALRRAILAHFSKVGFNGDKAPQFRLDMDKSPYLYVTVGRLPVKKTTGPEARAILNYYDGKKVKFQPKETD